MSFSSTNTTTAAADFQDFQSSWASNKKLFTNWLNKNGGTGQDDAMSLAWLAHEKATKTFRRIKGKSGAACSFNSWFKTCFNSLMLREARDISVRSSNSIICQGDDDFQGVDPSDNGANDPGSERDTTGLWRGASDAELLAKSKGQGARIKSMLQIALDGNSLNDYCERHGISVRTVQRTIHDFEAGRGAVYGNEHLLKRDQAAISDMFGGAL